MSHKQSQYETSHPDFQPMGNPAAGYDNSDHRFTLQCIMEQQKAVGGLQSEVQSLKVTVEQLGSNHQKLREDVATFHVKLDGYHQSFSRLESDVKEGFSKQEKVSESKLSKIESLIDKVSAEQRELLKEFTGSLEKKIEKLEIQSKEDVKEIKASVKAVEIPIYKYAGGLIVFAAIAGVVTAACIRFLFQ